MAISRARLRLWVVGQQQDFAAKVHKNVLNTQFKARLLANDQNGYVLAYEKKARKDAKTGAVHTPGIAYFAAGETPSHFVPLPGSENDSYKALAYAEATMCPAMFVYGYGEQVPGCHVVLRGENGSLCPESAVNVAYILDSLKKVYPRIIENPPPQGNINHLAVGT